MIVVRTKRRVFWIMFLFLIFLIIEIKAQDYSCDPSIEICDYGALLPDDYQNPIVYSDPAFYEESDPQYWEWDVVDWSMVDFSRVEIYQTKEFYQNLPEESYYYIDYTQVDYIEEALDYGKLDYTQIDYEEAEQSRIESDKYFADLDCTHCQLQETGGSITFSKNGISHTEGDFVSIPGEYPEGSLFVAKAEGIIVVLPSGTTELKLSERDKVLIDTNENEVTINRLSVKGKVIMNNGKMFAPKMSETTIESVVIGSGELLVQIYNDGKSHEGTFASLSDSIGSIAFGAAEGGALTLIFNEEGLQEGSFFVASEKEDLLRLSIKDGASGELLRREGYTSLLKLNPGNGFFSLENGINTYKITEEDMYLEPGYRKSDEIGSVPLTVIVLNEEGDLTGGREKTVFDNQGSMIRIGERSDVDMYGNVLIFEESVEDIVEKFKESHECDPCTFDFNRGSLLYTLSKEDIMKFTNIETITTSNPIALMKAANVLRELPKAERNSIKAIQIVPDDQLTKYCGQNTGGCAHTDTGEIIIPESNAGNYNLWLHEAAHTRTAELDAPSPLEKQSKEEALQLQRIGQESVEESQSTEQVQVDVALGKDFHEEWITITEGDYKYDLGELTVARINVETWSDGLKEARYGCVTPYACNNYWEDIAETAEVAATDPELYADLIDPKSSYYEEKMWKPVSGWRAPQIMFPSTAENWAEKYRKKLELSHQYGFITDEQYQLIVQENK